MVGRSRPLCVALAIRTGKYVAKCQSYLAGRRKVNSKTSGPETLVYVRMSREFLEDYIARTVRERKPVRGCILGTRVVGESYTNGKTRLVLRSSNDNVLGEIVFDGTVHSRTVGYNGPIVLHSISDATFRSRKSVAMGNSGLLVALALTSAHTRLRTTHIETSLPRLRGRIATRIAWRRSASLRGQAETISSQHTAIIISGDFDKRIDQSVASLRGVVTSQWSDLKLGRDYGRVLVQFRSTPGYAEMALGRYGSDVKAASLPPPPVQGNPDVAIRVHRTLLARADCQIASLTPVLLKLLKARIAERAAGVLDAREEQPSNPTKWSLNPNWLALDYTDLQRQSTPPAVVTHYR